MAKLQSNSKVGRSDSYRNLELSSYYWNFNDHMIERIRIEMMAKFIRTSMNLSNRTSKYVIYSQEEDGGLGFPDILSTYYNMLIINYMIRLNQEDYDGRMKENYIHQWQMDKDNRNKTRAENSMAGMVQNILENMQLQVAVTESGEIGIKIAGQTDQILEVALSY